MSKRPKFGLLKRDAVPDAGLDESFEPVIYPKVFETQGQRLRVAVSSGQIDLILKLAASLEAPFNILYVLLVASEAEAGRYQLTRTLDHEELSLFMNHYRDFFEQDARHDVWVRSAADNSMIVYDRHQILYLYGKASAFERVLVADGFRPGSFQIPFPHMHSYRSEFDVEKDSIAASPLFTRTPLQEGDEE